ncbi:MAG: DUF4386 domain-containing protein [Candidatus Limnocylindrales bacterium]
MSARGNTPRYLGAAFLGVVLTSLVSGMATDTALGTGSASAILQHVAANSGAMHVGILAGLLNAVGILILAALLFAVLEGQGRTMAIAALACWVGESFFYTLNQVASAGLIRLGTDSVNAGSPAGSFYETLGSFLYNDVYKLGGVILMFFYCAGGLLWYYLFYESRYVPRWLSLYGLAAVAVGLVGASAELLLGNNVGILPFIAILPFEVIIGLLLLLRGVREPGASA